MQLLNEVIVVGVVTLIVLVIIAYIMGLTESMQNLALAGFLTGGIVHLGMEYMGGNKWYCENGNACKAL